MNRFLIYWLLAIVVLVMMSVNATSQSVSATCNGATGICTGSSYSFPASTNAGTAELGANYGCLRTQPNPAWFFMRIKNTGSISIRMSSSPARDIDFILWGPFASATAPCVNGLDTTKIIDCSYSTASVETADIPNAVAGAYYIMLITNYSNRPTNITFSQTGGTGVSDCDVLCNITDITTKTSSCDTLGVKGAYTLSGTISVFSPPSSGTLTVKSSCGGSVTYNAPFGTTVNYSIPGITGKGENCYVTASFSSVATCNKAVIYTAPSCCNVSAVSPISSCAGQSLQLQASGTTGGVYHWSGPGGFTGNIAWPVIANATAANAGAYAVFLTHGSCTSNVATSIISLKTAPDTSLSLSGNRSFCQGDSLVLKASSDSGLTYQWQLNSTDILSASTKQYTAKSTGNYRVRVTGLNGCSLYSSQVAVTMNTFPDTTLTANGSLTFCSGQSVMLQVPYDSAAAYNWYYNDVEQPGSSLHTFISTQTGAYKVKVTRNNCSRSSLPVQINVVDKPVPRNIKHYEE
jgi:predicted secreted protein